MGKTFFKNLFKSIVKTKSRFLSIVIIIAVGVSFYAGVRASSPDMKMSADKYFGDNNFMDFKLISTLGITDDDVRAVNKLKDVSMVEGVKSMDAVIKNDQNDIVVNVESLPKRNGINKIQLVRGRLPKKNNEIILEERFFKDNKFKLGESLKLDTGSDANIDDSLKASSFKIVGTAKSPIYISSQRQMSSVGNGNVRGFVYIMPDDFKSDVYTSIYVKLNDKYSKTSLIDNEKYKDDVDSIKSKLEALMKVRGNVRYKDILKEAQGKINDAENKLNASKKDAEDSFSSAHSKLNDAQNKLNAGKLQFQSNEAEFNTQIKNAENQIQNQKNELQNNETQVNSKLTDAQKNKNSIESAKTEINSAQEKLSAEENIALKNASSAAEANAIESKYAAAQNDLNSKKQTIDSSEKAILDGEAKLQAALNQINDGKVKLGEGEKELSAKKNDGINKLNAAKQNIDVAQKEIDDNTQKLNSEENDTNKKFSDAEEKIQQNRDKLKDIKKAEIYVLGRNENIGYANYNQDTDRIDNIGKVFPLVFFLVAALVSLTTMTRMVQENRTEIGTFKALGYSSGAIVAHYLIYSLAASITGSIIGIYLGFKIFPPFIMNAYGSLYALPYISVLNFQLSLEASVIAVVFTTLASGVSAFDELKEVPASLMRPKPPKAGKKIFLERITFIWKRFNFTKKVTARNIFRYKQRFFMTVIGIAACTGLMITGFGLKSSIIGAVQKQFNVIYKYDMQTTINKNIDSDEKTSIENTVKTDDNIKSILFYYSKNAEVKKSDNSSEDIYVVVPEKKENLNKYIDLINGNSKLKLSDNGVIISKKVAKLMNKRVGDKFDITLDKKVIHVRISGITDQYVQHYIYMSPQYYKKVTEKSVQFNGFYGLLKNMSDKSQNKTSKIISGIKNIGAVSFKNNTYGDINKSTNSINSAVLILIASAGVLAFVVIYNLTNINISERNRELATIKVLGFYDNELAMYIYRENIVLTIIGSLIGIGFGMLLNVFVLSSAETDMMLFLRTVKPLYILFSVLLTMIFSIVVNIAMYRRFYKIDMIESLKSAE
ncbi:MULTISPECIES: FtsX-like permease family protein [Clostridium]|uniref:FtsX-like permease family protein n=1 Tax=Clostridium TaxID=1485 RepID=UPI0008242C7B|nr:MULTISPECIES: FtsX-like permease family protein [Clostridium]PJI07529.1 ABC transporter permease [Clostridium sp. CT7]